MERTYYKAKHILLSDLDDAEETYQELIDGADFDELAKKYSECPSADKGGMLGTFPMGTMAAEFERALSKLEFDELSKPVQTKYGWHLILRLER